MKNLIQGGLGVLVSGGIIVWMYLTLDWTEVGGKLGSIQYWVLVPCTFLFLLHFYVRALRWRYLLPNGGDSSLKTLFDSIMVGNLATYLLPLRAGEFIRPYMYTLRSRHSFSTSFVSVVIERFFDLAAVLLSFGVMTIFVEGLPEWVKKGAFLLSGLAVGIFLFIITGILFSEQILRIASVILYPLPPKLRDGIAKFLQDFLEGAKVLHDGKNLFIVITLTVAVWASCYLLFYVFLFLSPEFKPSLWLGVALGVIVALAVAAPSAPGFIGVFQVGCIAAFSLFGVDEEAGTAYALVTHLYQYVMVVLFGVLGLLRNGLSLRDLSRRQNRAELAHG